ncbi:hypothetical protein HK405_011579, partial [Cladochytrium tenue]
VRSPTNPQTRVTNFVGNLDRARNAGRPRLHEKRRRTSDCRFQAVMDTRDTSPPPLVTVAPEPQLSPPPDQPAPPFLRPSTAPGATLIYATDGQSGAGSLVADTSASDHSDYSPPGVAGSSADVSSSSWACSLPRDGEATGLAGGGDTAAGDTDAPYRPSRRASIDFVPLSTASRAVIESTVSQQQPPHNGSGAAAKTSAIPEAGAEDRDVHGGLFPLPLRLRLARRDSHRRASTGSTVPSQQSPRVERNSSRRAAAANSQATTVRPRTMAAVGRGDNDDDDDATAELGSNAAIVRVDSPGSPLVSAMRTAGGPPRAARSREGSNVSFRLAAATAPPPPPPLPPPPRRMSGQDDDDRDDDGDEADAISADGGIWLRAGRGNEPGAAGRARDEEKGGGDVPNFSVVASAPLTPAEALTTTASTRPVDSVAVVDTTGPVFGKAIATPAGADEPKFERQVAPQRQLRDSLTVPTLEEAAARAVAAAAARAPPEAAAKTSGVPVKPKGAEEQDWSPPPMGRRMSMFGGGQPGGGGGRRGSVSSSFEARRVHPLVKMLREWMQHVLEQPVTRAVLRVLGDHRAEILWWFLVMFLAHLAITVFLVLSLTIVMPGIWVYNFVQLYVILLVAVSLVAARKISYHVRVSMTASDLLRGTARMGELADFWVNGKLSPGHTTALASGVVEHLAEVLVIGCSILYSWEARESPLMEGNCIPPNYAGASLPAGVSIPDYMQGSVNLAQVYNFGLPLADGLVAGWA